MYNRPPWFENDFESTELIVLKTKRNLSSKQVKVPFLWMFGLELITYVAICAQMLSSLLIEFDM